MAKRVCSTPGCPTLIDAGAGRCDACKREAEAKRGSAAARGYNADHRHRFRAGVLGKHPICQVCLKARSTVADHWPMSRRELVAAGLDPSDPQHGRGLCKRCHARATATNQPGGWNSS